MAIAARPAQPAMETAASEDAAIVARLVRGESTALEELYDRYGRAVYSFSLRMLGDVQSAEELTQEVFIRLWRQAQSYQRSRGVFLTWLLSITHNMAIDEIRRRKRRPLLLDGNDEDQTLFLLPDTRTDVERDAWLSALQAYVRDALTEIPAAQREAIELAYFGGLTQREIADRLGEPLGTIKTRMRLGMLKLREHLGPLVELPDAPGPDEGPK
jgi:RNA polymerase sigma-70 factor (ECF subfamily)